MTEKRRRPGTPLRAPSGAGSEAGEAGLKPLFDAQRHNAEAVAAAYRKAFEGYTKILSLQWGLMKSLTEQAAGMGVALYRRPDRPEAGNALVEATRSATDAIANTTREIMETAGECCVEAMAALGERASAHAPETEEPHAGMREA